MIGSGTVQYIDYYAEHAAWYAGLGKIEMAIWCAMKAAHAAVWVFTDI